MFLPLTKNIIGNKAEIWILNEKLKIKSSVLLLPRQLTEISTQITTTEIRNKLKQNRNIKISKARKITKNI